MKKLLLCLLLAAICCQAEEDLYTGVMKRKFDLYLQEARRTQAVGQSNRSIDYYRKTIAFEEDFPEIENAYKELYELLIRVGDSSGATALKDEYLQRFPQGKFFASSAPDPQAGAPARNFGEQVPSEPASEPVPEPEKKSGWVRFRNKVKNVFRKVQDVSEDALGLIVSTSINATTQTSGNKEYIRRVEEIGSRVAAQSPRQDVKWRFRVVRDNDLNAFAVPGGYIYVNEGTVKATEGDDAALAGVLAHEVGHVTSRHSIHALERTLLFQRILDISKSSEIDKNKQNLLIAYAFLQELPISRENEYEADQWGVHLTHRAGYDPAGLVRFFDLLQKKYGGSSSKLGVLLSTHPATPDRIGHANGIIAGLQ
ncbi:MAG: M48 family metalloprotease [Candidatus Wallbacteria bacterium]|nr:M48 family metalloprotease [Candidatus Wallbacteria bacterium]